METGVTFAVVPAVLPHWPDVLPLSTWLMCCFLLVKDLLRLFPADSVLINLRLSRPSYGCAEDAESYEKLGGKVFDIV